MTELNGRTAFITGGANGIGLGIARAFAREGVKLALVDIDCDALERAKAELSGSTEVATAVLDMRDRESFAGVADTIEAALGPVSLLVNNAGVAGGAPAPKMGFELWDWGLGINLGGVVNGIQTFLPRMAARGGGGHIVNTSSGAGLAATGAGVLYHTAKYGVVGMSEALAGELEPLGIGVTVLCPGPVQTGIVARTRAAMPAIDDRLSKGERADAKERRGVMSRWLGRGTSPETVGDMIVDAIRRGRLYVHTDRFMVPSITERCRALLDAMPAETIDAGWPQGPNVYARSMQVDAGRR